MADAPAPQPPSPPAAGRQVGGRNLPVAIGSGLLLAGLFLGSLFWDPLAFTIVVAAFACLAIVEVSQVLRTVGVPVALPALLVGALTIVFGAHRASYAGQVLGVFALFLATVLWLLVDPRRRDVVRTLGFTLLLGLWTAGLGSFGVLLVNRVDGAVAVLAVVGGAIVGDIGAYAAGVLLGRHKLAPRISPNKTWEGLVGGLVAAAVLGALVLPPLSDAFDVATAVVVVLVSAAAGVVGDLAESMIKRDLAVKDLGWIIPGHGGILDRVDGILLALPVGYYALTVVT